jgi:2,4-dienoyl-CoA reductase-like NADH-dependent reductase (Old Yellow Enzyme family)/thioredoxin reductase
MLTRSSPQFPMLFEPGSIGCLEIKNRIIMPPMITLYVTPEGGVTERLIEHYVERARGGAGLIITEASYPRPSGYSGRICLNNDKLIPGLERLVQAVHREGVKIVCEINPHRGRADEYDPASASEIPHPFTGVVPRQLSSTNIKELVQAFGEGVRRAKEAGYDGVMIHGGYLVEEFLSPMTNKRKDEYGGDVKGRARLALELVRTAKEKAGPKYPVTFRLQADEKVPEGFEVKDAIVVCKMLQEEGIDAVDICAGCQETPEWMIPTRYWPPGCNADLAQAIRRELSIPVSVAGKINDPYIAERILEEGKADFVDMGRALIADPELPNKAMEGRVNEIRKCIACQRCVETTNLERIPLICSINPASGRENEFNTRLRPAHKKKRVLVVGGGPGGMEAAIISAQKGLDVTLWEAEDRLGGQLILSLVPPGKESIESFLSYLKMELEKLKVRIELQKRATVAAVTEYAPEVIIIATGSTPSSLDIPGIESHNVMDCRQVLSGESQTGDRVVIIGAGLIGCETADFLAQQGKKVTLACPEDAPMSLEIVDRATRKLLLDRLEAKTVEIFAGIKQFLKITPQAVVVTNKEGNESNLETDSVVLSTGSLPDNSLARSVKGKVPEIYEVGDCVAVRRISHAVLEGAQAALRI